MTEVIRKTESTFSGPWLLDSAALAALDEIIDEQWARLEAHKKRQIDKTVRRERDRFRRSNTAPGNSEDDGKLKDKEIRQRVENTYTDDGRTLTLTFMSGNKVRVNCFSEAATDASCQDQEVAKVEVRICCGDVRGDLVVPTPDKNHGLSLVTLPEASNQAVELFYTLHKWSEQYKPDWFRWICGLHPATIWMSAIFFIIFSFVIGMVTGSIVEENAWKDEVRVLTAKGVKPEDHGRALELLLQEAAHISTERSAI